MRKLLLMITCCIFISSCDDADISPGENPFVILKKAEVNNNSVELLGEIKNLGTSPILSHGFIWSKGTTIDSTNLYIKPLSTEARKGDFSFIITSDLIQNQEYTVRPYIETTNTLVLGTALSFESKGSEASNFDQFHPKTSALGDTITITGNNFSLSESRTKVFIGDHESEVISLSTNEIKVIVPFLFTNEKDHSLQVTSGEFSFQFNDKVTILGRRIEHFFPAKGIIGETELVIEGSHFLDSGNQVFIGPYTPIIHEENSSQIKVKLPYSMKTGNYNIHINYDDDKAVSTNQIEVLSRWKKLSDFPGNFTTNPVSVLVNDKLFLINQLTYSTEVWVYDLKINQWQQLDDFPNSSVFPWIGFNVEDKLYYAYYAGSGSNDIWSLDTETLEWSLEEQSITSITGAVSATINDKAFFFGLAYDFETGNEVNIQEYTQSTGLNLINSFSSKYYIEPETSSIFYYENSIFIIANEGYKTSNYKLLKFEPDSSNSLEFISDVPFNNKPYAGISFALADLYIGEGFAHDSFQRSFYKYDVESDHWTRIEDFQGGNREFGTISFSYNGKGYAGLGYSYDSRINRGLWVYDPQLYNDLNNKQ